MAKSMQHTEKTKVTSVYDSLCTGLLCQMIETGEAASNVGDAKDSSGGSVQSYRLIIGQVLGFTGEGRGTRTGRRGSRARRCLHSEDLNFDDEGSGTTSGQPRATTSDGL